MTDGSEIKGLLDSLERLIGEAERRNRTGEVASVQATTSDQVLSVELTDGSSYTVPYLDLKTVDQMLAERPGVSYTVDGKVRQ